MNNMDMLAYVCDKRIRDVNMGDFYNKHEHLVVALPRELYGHAFLERMFIRACLYAKRVVSISKTDHFFYCRQKKKKELTHSFSFFFFLLSQ